MNKLLKILAVITVTYLFPLQGFSQKFIHPGINQTAGDLAYMKKLVLEGREPWKGAFERLKAETDPNFTAKPFAHVLRGPYGRPNIGGNELSQSARMAYNCALLWYITDDRAYADKAIAILNAWSPVLHDFDYNDAKLLAAWTGHVFCNAAEILRYTNAGWKQQDIDRFTNMLMTVYYPLIRFYFPHANGNWDGAIIHTIMSIGIFTDNRALFNNAVDHFLHGTGNGSIFKYIYPSGQCQESMRDQGHVQLGLGEFAGAAQVAYTQGVDLFSIGNNRIGLGYEYTAGFLLGEKPYCYGVISERSKKLRDDYEYVYRHYAAQGISLPHVKAAADSVRPEASRSILTAVRDPSAWKGEHPQTLTISTTGYIAGAGAADGKTKAPADAIIVIPGQSVQDALNTAAATGRQVVLKAGLHKLPATLKIPSGVTLSGEGTASVLFLDPGSGNRDAMVNATDDLHDVTIRDLVVEGALQPVPGTDPNSSRSFHNKGNRGGIIFRSETGEMRHISFTNLTVRNCTYNGVFISGANDIHISRCNFNENGAAVVPGPKLQHNLLLTYCTGISITDSRADTSPFGSGIALDHCSDASVSRCEIARNAYYGLLISEGKNVSVTGNLIEGNDRSGVMVEFLHQGAENIRITDNRIHFNTGYGVESYAAGHSKAANNTYAGNGTYTGAARKDQEKISDEKLILME